MPADTDRDELARITMQLKGEFDTVWRELSALSPPAGFPQGRGATDLPTQPDAEPRSD